MTGIYFAGINEFSLNKSHGGPIAGAGNNTEPVRALLSLSTPIRRIHAQFFSPRSVTTRLLNTLLGRRGECSGFGRGVGHLSRCLSCFVLAKSSPPRNYKSPATSQTFDRSFSVSGDSEGRRKAFFVVHDPRGDRGGGHKRPRARVRAKILHRSDTSLPIGRQTLVPGTKSHHCFDHSDRFPRLRNSIRPFHS